MTNGEGNGRDRDAAPLRVRAAERDLSFDDLAYLNRMTTVGQVLPTVAHELNNALQVVGGLVEMLAARADLPPDVREKVGRIGSQAARATSMIRDLVGFARRDDAAVRTVDLAGLVERALMMRRYHLARARIAVGVEGAVAGVHLTRADPHALLQALLNVLINAEQGLAHRDGGAIRLAIRDAGDATELEVADNGPGVPAAARARVAEPFFTTQDRAAGLGLTVAPALVRLGDGQFLVEHRDEGGTRVLMTLPKPPPTG